MVVVGFVWPHKLAKPLAVKFDFESLPNRTNDHRIKFNFGSLNSKNNHRKPPKWAKASGVKF
jgi:hypothetical protein